MSYTLEPINNNLESFHFGSFSFGHLLEACGYLWPCIHKMGKWFCVFGVDERFPIGDEYPSILTNDGFTVTLEEANIMARIARNWVAVQQELLLADHPVDEADDLFKPCFEQQWPRRVRDDWVEIFKQFAEWAEQSNGFTIE